MNHYKVNPIGKVHCGEEGFVIEIEKEYIPGLEALNGFSHINVIWWFSRFDEEQFRFMLQSEQPYEGAPEIMGVFATRSPLRPNPIALTPSEVIDIDYEKGRIQVAYIDAEDGTPVLDIKPYTPSFDRIEDPGVPNWCSHWPKSAEESAEFEWESVFKY